MTEKTCLDFNTLARLCPLGWVELQVEHHPGDSGPGGSTPAEPDTSIHLARVWGLTPDDIDGVNAALDELYRDAEVFHAIARKAPHLGLLQLRRARRARGDRGGMSSTEDTTPFAEIWPRSEARDQALRDLPRFGARPTWV